jgi:VanZ family protein
MGPRLRTYITAFLPAILWLLVIVALSSSWASATTTEKLIVQVLRALGVPLTPAMVQSLNHLSRIAAHLVLYGVFAFLVWRGFERLPQPPRLTRPRMLVIVLLIVATCAAAVELHLWTLLTRTGAERDIVLDASGGALGLLVSWIYRRRVRHPAAAAVTAPKS